MSQQWQHPWRRLDRRLGRLNPVAQVFIAIGLAATLLFLSLVFPGWL